MFLCVCVYKDQDSNEPEPSDWERYAAEEYELLVAEEGAVDTQPDDASVYSIQFTFFNTLLNTRRLWHALFCRFGVG